MKKISSFLFSFSLRGSLINEKFKRLQFRKQKTTTRPPPVRTIFMKTLKDFNFKGKRVLLRCDFNVPLNEKGNILDDFRIRQAIPSIEYLIKKGGKILLISHLGRPEGKFVKKFSLRPVALRLRKLLKRKIRFLEDCIGERVEKEAAELRSSSRKRDGRRNLFLRPSPALADARAIKETKIGEVVLLENLRFYKEEQENDQDFAKALSRLGDIFINDAFSVCHRSHASVVGITKYLPSGAGLLLKKEIRVLSQVIENPKRPLVVVIGGKKVEDKAKVVEKFSKMADFVLTGGLVAEEIKKGKIKIKSPQKVFFPVDEKNGLDIGQKTIKIFKEKIQKAKTIFWAGPLGKIEEKKYQKGTKAIARAISQSDAFSVVGGGDTVEFINRINHAEKFNHVSIGGGAMLEFLAGEKLPGLEALRYEDKKS